MKKILIVFDGEHFSRAAFDMACRINEMSSPILLTGLFLSSVDYTDVIVYYIGGMAGPLSIPLLESNPGSINENIQKFKILCERNGIEYRIHTETKGHVLETIRKESRYADQLMLSSELFYSNLGEASQQEYLNDAMHFSECPVMIIPEKLDYPQSIILAYDGSPSSVYAIKQFAYLYPAFSQLETLLVYASNKDEEFPDYSYIEEFAARHYKNLTFFKLDANPKKYFNTWIEDAGKALLVSGSHSRSSLSEIFRKSFISEVIKDHKLPIFIAHP